MFPDEESISTVMNINPNKAFSLIILSRKHNVKLTALLVVLINLSIIKVIPRAGQDAVISVPFDMRPHLKKSEIEMLGPSFSTLCGLNISAESTHPMKLVNVDKVCLNGKVDWDVVKYVNNKIHRNAENGSLAIGLLKFVDGKQYFKKQNRVSLEHLKFGVVRPEIDNIDNIVNIGFDQPSQVFNDYLINIPKCGLNIVLHCVNNTYRSKLKVGIEEEVEKLLSSN